MPSSKGFFDLQDRSLRAGGDPLLRIGAWTHLDWNGGLDRLQLAFFDHHLRDRPPPHPLARERFADLTTANWAQQAEALHPEIAAEGMAPWRLGSQGLACIDGDEGRLLRPGKGERAATSGWSMTLGAPCQAVADTWASMPDLPSAPIWTAAAMWPASAAGLLKPG